MSRLQSILTGIATAIALVLVVLSIDFTRLAASFHALRAAPVALAVILLAANFLLAFFRFTSTLGALGVMLERRAAAYAFALGNLASQFLLNIIGQSLTRAMVLQATGVPPSATVAATYLERLLALATIGIGAALSALMLFGSFGFELHDGGAYFVSIALATAAVLAAAGLPGLKAAIGAAQIRAMLRTSVRLAPALVISLLAHLAMFGAYFVLVREFAPDIAWVRLAPAIVIVMFAAGLPVSWAGWGLREFGAVYALGAIGVPSEAAVIVAVMVGAVSLLIALAAGGAVVLDTWLRPAKSAAAKPTSRDGMARALAPSDPLFMWVIGILTACLVYLQLRVPSGPGELTVNAADPLAITALFFAAVFAWTDRFLDLYPRVVLRSAGVLAASLVLGLLVAWLGPGLTAWALLNRMLGFLFLLGYAAVPGLVVLIAGERGRAILAHVFVVAAVAICAIQVIAYVFHHYVTPLPTDFFGYLFAESDQLEGYAQNSNAFAFQLLMALAILIAARRQLRQEMARTWLLAAALLVTLALARSRAGLLCALATVALAPLLEKWPARSRLTRRALVVGSIAGAVLVAGIALWGPIDDRLIAPLIHAIRPGADESDALRWQSTVLGLQAWLRHPVLGGGLGTFLLERETAGLPLVVVHSVPIWFLAEMGLVGLAAYLVFVVSLAVSGVASFARSDGHARGLLIVVAVFVLMGLVHDIFFQRTFWFACGLLLVDGAGVAPRREAGHPDTTDDAREMPGAR
ncbi:MAG TPA: lysylphosphatidylglycerol synthase transmembrane domain-containing protein [Xanthobacteraceae bacterium]|nr:lysylphosphatidylglycerol synthase transmembrane domain-containing protein [Xanthobacteraceae bacterium]